MLCILTIARGSSFFHAIAFILKSGLPVFCGFAYADVPDIGFTVAVAVTRLLRGMLFGVSPTDPVAFAGIGALLLSVALGAAYLPALRATRTNPVETLRE